MAISSIRQQITEHIDELESHLRDQIRADKSPEDYERALAMTLDVRKAFEADKLHDAIARHGLLRRFTMDSLPLADTLLKCTDFLEKYLPILRADYRCPYCDGNLRSAKAKQCPECMRDWHDPDNVKMLVPPR